MPRPEGFGPDEMGENLQGLMETTTITAGDQEQAIIVGEAGRETRSLRPATIN